MINRGGNWRKKDGRRESTLQIPKELCHWVSDSISVCIVGFAYCTFKQIKKRTNLRLYFSILCSTTQAMTTTTPEY